MGRKIALFLIAAPCAGLCAFLIFVMVSKGLDRAGALAVPLGTIAGAVAAGATLWALVPRRAKPPLPPDLEVPDWVIPRAEELTPVVKALTRCRSGTVGITAGLSGAGGFGKTTLAQMVCADRRVRRRFAGGIYPVTLGRDVRGAAAIAAKVNDVIKLVSGEDATFTDPQLAGRRLGSLLNAGPRKLLVVDDVWEPEQLAPLTAGGKRCARLITTRVPELLGSRAVTVKVDKMSPDQAKRLLNSGLPDLDSAVADELLTVTGRWPLLLKLVNKILVDTQAATDVSAQGTVLAERLRAGGPTAVDDLAADSSQGLDVGRPQQRARAVQATIQASTSLLSSRDAERFKELGVFAEDEAIPFAMVAQLWQSTAGLDDLEAARTCHHLSRLALISHSSQQSPGISLHDVIRDFLRAELGLRRLARLNGLLLDAVAAGLRPAAVTRAEDLDPSQVSWWNLGDEHRYLWDHLIEHLLDAGRPDDAEATACDLRWAAARLQRFGPAAPAADLADAGTAKAARLRAVLDRAAHLLAPTHPPEAVTDILHSRVADDPDWGLQVSALRDACPRPRLVNRWPLPDLPDPALVQVWAPDRAGEVLAVAGAPDGRWLAAGGGDGKVRIRNLADGQSTDVSPPRDRRSGRPRPRRVTALAAAPDGQWLASASADGTVRILDAATGRRRRVMIAATRRDRRSRMSAVAIAPDGSWITGGSTDGLVRIWTVATGFSRGFILLGHGPVGAVAIARDGRWLAYGGGDGTITVSDAANGKRLAMLAEHADRVTALAPTMDGSRLISGSSDGTIRIWDTATWEQQAVLASGQPAGRGRQVTALALAPDDSWLASASDDEMIHVWDVVTLREESALRGHGDQVTSLAVTGEGTRLLSGSRDGTARIWNMTVTRPPYPAATPSGGVTAIAGAPDGTWLTSLGHDGHVRAWDTATGHARASLLDEAGEVTAIVGPPDGSWLAAAVADGTIKVVDMTTGRERPGMMSHAGRVTAMAAAPDGTWQATAGDDGTVRVWDTRTGQELAALHNAARARKEGKEGTAPRPAVAVAPDGTWLALGGNDGRVLIWDAVTWQRRATLPGDTGNGAARTIAIAPDASWLAVTYQAKAPDAVTGLCIWDAGSWKQRHTLPDQDGSVTALAATPDGKSLVTGDAKGTLRLCDVATRDVRVLMRVDNTISALAWLGTDALAIGGAAGLYVFDFRSAATGDLSKVTERL